MAVCRAGSRSAHATAILQKAGFADIANLPGGICAGAPRVAAFKVVPSEIAIGRTGKAVEEQTCRGSR